VVASRRNGRNVALLPQQPDFSCATLAGIAVNAASGLLKPEREWLWRKRRAKIAAMKEEFRRLVETEPGRRFSCLRN
jgi:hypothetical protein